MKRLLVLGIGGDFWMGGVIYIKNMIYQLSCIERFSEKYKVYMLVPTDNRGLYDEDDWGFINVIEGNLNTNTIIEIVEKNKIDIVMPVSDLGALWMLVKKCVCWIPDFQEIHLPHNFDQYQVKARELNNRFCAKHHCSLILSSSDAYSDYMGLYPSFGQNVFVVPFVSYLEKDMRLIDDRYKKYIFDKYNLPKEYLYVANQFWKHKNYEVLFRGIRVLAQDYKMDVHLVCTGNMVSYAKDKNGDRYDKYVSGLIDYIKKEHLDNNIHLLGVINRRDQLAIMKYSTFVVQPSLFEGWGCTVEDAKYMGKRLLLSDIPVHREQMTDSDNLFDRFDEFDFASKVKDTLRSIVHNNDYCEESAKILCQERARLYAKYLEQALNAIPSDNEDYKREVHNLRVERAKRCAEEFVGDRIGIYGVGKHTDVFFPVLSGLLDNKQYVFFDSSLDAQGMLYEGHRVYSPKDIGKLNITDIVVSSRVYQDDIVSLLKEMNCAVNIHCLYLDDEEKMIRLFDS